MPIALPEMPAAVAAALANGLPRFAVAASATGTDAPPTRVARPSLSTGARAIARSVEAALAEGSTAGVGAPMAVLGLDDLAAGKPLRQARAQLWAQLLPGPADGERALAEVDPQAGQLTSVSHGPDVKALARRIHSLTTARTRSTAQQSLSLIRVPALHLTAVWLQDASGEAGDVVIPNDGPIAPLVPGQRYPLAEFQRIVGKMAAERLAKTRDDMGG